MADYPYLKSQKNLPRFMSQIKAGAVPSKVDMKYLKSMGFTSSNDQALVPLFKSIGFVDSSGAPTERWSQYCVTDQAARVLAKGIREAYSQLFEVYPDAHRKDDEAIRNVFKAHTSVAEETVSRMLGTFKGLTALADFGNVRDTPAEAPSGAAATTNGDSRSHESANLSGMTLDLNIQLALPATDDMSVYDKIFASMKKHLMS